MDSGTWLIDAAKNLGDPPTGDHLIPFPLGPTSEENLHCRCRRHHGLKHEGGWPVEATSNRGLRWISPQGATATTHPDDTKALAA